MKCAFILLLLLTSVGRRYPINLDTLKYEIVGKLVVVHAKVDGNYGNFILDTGIRDLVLNSKYYQVKRVTVTFKESMELKQNQSSVTLIFHLTLLSYPHFMP